MKYHCSKCGSGNIIPDYDHVRHIAEQKCLSCGSRDIKAEEVEMPKTHDAVDAQVKMKGRHKKCVAEGCAKYQVKKGLCWLCYKEKYGVNPYKSKKGGKELDTFKTVDSKAKAVEEKGAVGKNLTDIAIKKTEIYELRDGVKSAEIFIEYGVFKKCLMDWVSSTPEDVTLEDWLFLGKVSKEIERLAGKVER